MAAATTTAAEVSPAVLAAARAEGEAAAGGAQVSLAGGARTAAAVLALVQASSAARDQLDAALAAFLRRAVGSFSGWYSPTAVRDFAGQVAPQVTATQQAVADLTLHYLRQVGTLYEHPPLGLQEPVTLPAQGLRGVDPVEVYSRPAETFRYERSAGASPLQARERAVARLERMAIDDLNLAQRAGTEAAQKQDELLLGFRRVIHPELSKGGSCGLCVAAATDPNRFYKSAEQFPFHSMCHCSVLPVYAGQADPGRYMNAVSLGQLYYDAAGSGNTNETTDGAALKRTRYSVDEHGELGATLVPVREHQPRPKAPAAKAASSS